MKPKSSWFGSTNTYLKHDKEHFLTLQIESSNNHDGGLQSLHFAIFSKVCAHGTVALLLFVFIVMHNEFFFLSLLTQIHTKLTHARGRKQSMAAKFNFSNPHTN